MKKIVIAICFTFGLSGIFGVSGLAIAETVKIPLGQQANDVWSGKTPTRGSSKQQVEAEFGTPDSKMGPNGNPPIYYWEYPDFTVYFESNFVLHSVIKHRPKH